MSKLSILLIDDDAMSNVFNSIILKRNYPTIKIHTTRGASEAIDYLKADPINKPSIIFLDLNMPVMNGWDFMEEYKKLNLGIDVVLVTSSDDIKDIARSKDYDDIKHYLVKPITVENLAIVLTVLLT